MVFNSVHFVLFFVVVYALYRVLPHRAQNWLLLLSSYYFYGAWDWRFLSLLMGSTVVDYFCALYIASRQSPRARRFALVVSLAFNLTMLGFFKYFNFFAESLQTLASTLGWHVDTVTLRVILPIGISFYTFMTMSYVIDVYRRDIEPTRHPLDFAVFVAYFPHLVAGPILRASALIPQIARRRTITREQVAEGAWLVGYGLFKKMFVADNLAKIADAVFARGASPTGLEILLGLYAFAFQIYGDFSGYSDIARGVSKWMGIELNVNFRFPYFVDSAQQFWRHWHISLSTWLRDYLYIPLGGNRGTPSATRRNLFLTMLLGGLWHGAAWNFVIWGAYQGVLLGAYRIVDAWRGHRAAGNSWPPRWPHAPGVLVMFHLTCYGWLIFRARSATQIAEMSSALLTNFAPSAASLTAMGLPLLFYSVPLLVIHGYEAHHDDLAAVFRLPLVVRYAILGAMFYLVALFGDFAGSQFIYFQF
jgi:D-alanyl-lipoteichoic acid acyltransferase DltB (MBOAT superfamily)